MESSGAVSQRDADLLHFLHKYRRSAEGSSEKSAAQRQLVEELACRSPVDSGVEMIGDRLFGPEEGPKVLNAVRPAGMPLVDDWDCLKSMLDATTDQVKDEATNVGSQARNLKLPFGEIDVEENLELLRRQLGLEHVEVLMISHC
ncbi:hypothetical protein ACQ4PT_000223 [Festuca glaucescens]